MRLSLCVCIQTEEEITLSVTLPSLPFAHTTLYDICAAIGFVFCTAVSELCIRSKKRDQNVNILLLSFRLLIPRNLQF